MFNTNDEFTKKLISIAIPVALQSLISTSLNLIDSIMIGVMKESSLAAVGIANKYYYFFILIVYGICSGTAIFTSQFWGKRDIKNIKKVMAINVISVLIISIIFTLGAQLFSKEIIKIFLKESIVINLGSDYLKIVSFSYIITSISMAFATSFRSIGKAKVMMYYSVIALICNTILNYIFIFGKLGISPKGVQGAAYATVIARIIELSLILSFTYIKNTPLKLGSKDLLSIRVSLVKSVYKRALPVVINEGLWSLGTIIYCIAYGEIGAGAIALIQISDVLQNFFMIIGKGISTSASVMIGNLVGKGDYKKVIDYTKKILKLGTLSGFLMGFILIIMAPFFINYYNISDVLKIEGIKTLRVIGIFLGIKILNVITISGIFRGAGETVFSSILDVMTVWFIGIPMAFLSVIVFDFPLHIVVGIVALEEVVKSIVAFKRIYSNKWIKNIVDEFS
ncbi:MATE family efflux transporter [Oceanirhabdus sp. W0125-5]|uniref:MATE family efflux transporter n=1 Tax=Oceanirhabdus sp. W0125-5 TaxID=2999116 RepID=UPI0022F2BB59|nr:MATE family efflux transporter [Oceanirhabdus sp. W0125-5]WBW94869.1 MATE family efflux transporter [Oceanirhabdus sp. W0125-5]